VTSWAAQGKFTQEPHTVLFCAVSRPDVDPLRSAVTEGDPTAFLVIGHGHQATGGMVRREPAATSAAAEAAGPPAPAPKKVNRPGAARRRRTDTRGRAASRRQTDR
jgi:hypothetical protein